MSECDPRNCELLKLKEDFGLTIDDYSDYKQSLAIRSKESQFNTTLYLFRDSIDSGFGKLYLRGVLLCDTLENILYKFPVGDYRLEYSYSPRFKRYLYEITGISGRSRILIHSGNYQSHSKGCVLVGFRQGDVLACSKLTLDRVNDIIKSLNILKISVRYA